MNGIDEETGAQSGLPAELPASEIEREGLYWKIERAIVQAETLDDIRQVRNVAEALQRLAHIAKDRGAETRLARYRLRAEREAGIRLREMAARGERHTRGGDQKSNSQVGTLILKDFGITKNDSAAWQRLAEIPAEDFEKLLNAIVEHKGWLPGARTVLRLKQVTEDAPASDVSPNADEWLTPPEIVAAASRSLGGIALDPCAETFRGGNVNAVGRFTKRDDGLRRPWDARTVFMNPPRSEFGRWVEKLKEEMDATGRAGSERHIVLEAAIAVLPMEPGAEWFIELDANAVCFVAESWRRACEPRPPYPLVVAYFGRAALEFARVFEWAGPVFAPVGVGDGKK